MYRKYALLLKALALQKLGKVKDAIKFYKYRLSMEPDCEMAKKGIEACREIKKKKRFFSKISLFKRRS